VVVVALPFRHLLRGDNFHHHPLHHQEEVATVHHRCPSANSWFPLWRRRQAKPGHQLCAHKPCGDVTRIDKARTGIAIPINFAFKDVKLKEPSSFFITTATSAVPFSGAAVCRQRGQKTTLTG
jgi:hypothetical protein